ncbi:MAG: hypothetical protein Aurels2KO_52670 [Aureliella sp.]
MRSGIHSSLGLLSVAVAITAAFYAQPLLAQNDASETSVATSTPDWIRGSGKALELRLTGRVVDPQGKDVEDGTAQIRMTYNSKTFTQVAAPIRDGQFSSWLPVNKHDWYAIVIDAATPDGLRFTYRISRQELRELVVQGLTLELQRTSKTVRVKTTFEDQAVENATVRVTLDSGAVLRSTSNASGDALFELLPKEKLDKLTAWTKSGLLGGYQLSKKPTRDPLAQEHTVKMLECQPMQVRVKDEAGKPIAGVSLEVQAATPAPNFNYFGMPDASHVTTNDEGIATYKWFPKIDSPHAYATILDSGWLKVSSDLHEDHIELVSAQPTRRTITGQVSGGSTFAGGLGVNLYSFDGSPSMDASEGRYVFTDADGSFTAQVVPDATYGYYVDDFRWSSQMSDGVLADSATGKSVSPVLFLSEGIPVRIELTAGPSHDPIEGVYVGMQTQHSFSWEVDFRKQNGTVSRHVRVRSDENGVVEGFAPEGKLSVNFYTRAWNKRVEYEVRRDQENVFEFHRASAGAVTVKGQLTCAEGDVSFAEIHVGSIDGESRDSFDLKADRQGRFELETISSRLAVLAISKDGLLAATGIIDDVLQLAEFELTPTMPYQGRVVDANNQPVAGHNVAAKITVGITDYSKLYPTSFTFPPIETKTDAIGAFEFASLPSKTEISITVDDQQLGRPRTIDTVFLIPGESRPLKIATTVETPKPPVASKLPQERYDFALRDCRLFNYNLMAIVSDPSDEAASMFVRSDITNRVKIPTTSGYMHLVLDTAAVTRAPLAVSKDWPEVPAGSVFICLYDANGSELSRRLFDVTSDQTSEGVAEFVKANAPAQVDALETWSEAFAEARRTNRKVWIIAGGRYCGKCFHLGHWIDDNKKILEQDFVLAKVDGSAHKNGLEVSQRFILGRQVGIPFHAMFDAGENMLADSFGPLGNIGSITGFEGTRHFRKMLEASCEDITPQQIDELIASLPSDN